MVTLFAIFAKWPKCKNEQPYNTFAVFLKVGTSSGGSWRLSWEGFGAILEDVGSKMLFFGYLGGCCGILVPRWRTRAPRRDKTAELRRRKLLQEPCDEQRWSPCTLPENWILQIGYSSMGLQTPTPTGTGSGKLEDLENRRTGGLEDWMIDDWLLGPSTLLSSPHQKAKQKKTDDIFWKRLVRKKTNGNLEKLIVKKAKAKAIFIRKS